MWCAVAVRLFLLGVLTSGVTAEQAEKAEGRCQYSGRRRFRNGNVGHLQPVQVGIPASALIVAGEDQAGEGIAREGSPSVAQARMSFALPPTAGSTSARANATVRPNHVHDRAGDIAGGVEEGREWRAGIGCAAADVDSRLWGQRRKLCRVVGAGVGDLSAQR